MCADVVAWDAKTTSAVSNAPAFRAQVSANRAPYKGRSTAPVTIVEFSDFHSPFCKRMLPTLTQLKSQFGDKVELVLRDDPIDPLHASLMS